MADYSSELDETLEQIYDADGFHVLTPTQIDEAKAKLSSLLRRVEVDEAKHLEQAMGKKFEELCRRVETDPYLGNSSKSKKDNFIDGAELMLIVPSLRIQELEGGDK